MAEVIRTSVNIPTDVLIKVKAIAVKKGTSQNNIINEFIGKGIENIEKTTNKEPKLKFKDLAGRYSAGKEFSAVEDIKKMRNGEKLE
ncbi:MAG: hypothetical protein ACRC1M_04095 [Methanobacteriaceae archaeon]